MISDVHIQLIYSARRMTDAHSNSCASFVLCIAGLIVIVTCLVIMLLNGLIFYIRKVCLDPPDNGNSAMRMCNNVTAASGTIITLTGLAMLTEVIFVS